MRAVLLLLLLCTGSCAWNNSLYQARVESSRAMKAEREERPGDAENAWRMAATKAESAYVRGSTTGDKAAESLWLQGRALARVGDCGHASPALERSALLRRDAPWRELLMFELAHCREVTGDRGAIGLYQGLVNSRDSAMRTLARRRAGDALIREERWSDALEILAGLYGTRESLNRATAFASLGRGMEAIAELRPLVELGDTSTNFAPIVGALAARNTQQADALLATLAQSRGSTAARRANDLLAAIQGGMALDPAATDRRLRELLSLGNGNAVQSGRLLLLDRVIARASTPRDLRTRIDSLPALVEDGLPVIRARELRRIGLALFEEERSTAAGAPLGDLAIFVLAETARDSLSAPHLASWLLARVERDWPGSPYVAKALLARLPLEPDSAASLQQRLGQQPDNPYVAYLRGAQDGRFVQLEDSLRLYLRDRALAATGRRKSGGGNEPPDPE